jgi:hypothetical protein
VLRRLLLAVLFCLSAWAVADRTSAALADSADSVDSAAVLAANATTASPVGSTGASPVASIGATVATPPIDTHPPEARWEALLPQGIGNGSSRNDQSLAQAADLPGVSSRVPWLVVRSADAARHAARFRPAHLLHTPLLI